MLLFNFETEKEIGKKHETFGKRKNKRRTQCVKCSRKSSNEEEYDYNLLSVTLSFTSFKYWRVTIFIEFHFGLNVN